MWLTKNCAIAFLGSSRDMKHLMFDNAIMLICAYEKPIERSCQLIQTCFLESSKHPTAHCLTWMSVS